MLNLTTETSKGVKGDHTDDRYRVTTLTDDRHIDWDHRYINRGLLQHVAASTQ